MSKKTGVSAPDSVGCRVRAKYVICIEWLATVFVSLLAAFFLSATGALAVALPPGPACDNTNNAGQLNLTCPANTFCNRGGNFLAGETITFSFTIATGPFTFSISPGGGGFVNATSSTNFVFVVPADANYTFTYDNSGNAANSTNITASCTPASSGADMNKDTVSHFVANHWSSILGVYSEHRTPLPYQSDTPDDVFQDGTGTEPVSINALGGTFSFEASARSLIRGIPQTQMVEPAAAMRSVLPQRWDAWLKGIYTSFDNDDTNVDGETFVVMGGIDYLVRDDILVGILAGYDHGDQDSGTLDAEYEVDGFIVGPYASVRLDEELTFYGRAAWGMAEHGFETGATVGETDSQRFLVVGNLKGTYWDFFPVRLTPNVAVHYVNERLDGFVDSGGTPVSSTTVELGRLEFGGEVGYRIRLENGYVIDPYLAFHGLWDFVNEGSLLLSPTISARQSELRARVGAGVLIQIGDNAHVNVRAEYDGIGTSDFDAWTLHGRVAIPLD